MNEPLPAPEFDRTKYDRPNQDWVCGRTCEGKPCRKGPTPGGLCRSTAECRPVLELRPGEKKGQWKCTRPKEAGGPCETGPAPNGDCGCPIIPCVPQRSLRNLRGRLTLATIAVTIGLLVLLSTGRWRWSFISPGPVSNPHQSGAFDLLAATNFDAVGCAGCHIAAKGGLGQWLDSAFNVKPGPFAWGDMARDTPNHHTFMDENRCLKCHVHHDRHLTTTDFVAAHSCSDCHREHRGNQLASPSDDTCATCHNNGPRITQFALDFNTSASANNSMNSQPQVAAGLVAFITPRPTAGRTNLFAHFWDGHPDFGVHRAGIPDGNTLKFNHRMHLGETVRLHDRTQGKSRALNCSDCHRPDATGAYMSRIRFDQHCKSCHSLQFDPVNPEVHLPHGDVSAVRATVSSLASLQVQYAELARRKGITERAGIEKFVRDSSEAVKKLLGTNGGDELVEKILFIGDPRERMQPSDRADGEKRGFYAGCAYCHEVGRDPQYEAVITRPMIPDRWLLGGRFTHAKHTQVSCVACHSTVPQSSRSADINLPHQVSCAACHSPGNAAANCATCHSYHMGKPL